RNLCNTGKWKVKSTFRY
ncbi:leucine--tRNA ligase, partial [Chlamydia psittaci 08-2626_L3]